MLSAEIIPARGLKQLDGKTPNYICSLSADIIPARGLKLDQHFLQNELTGADHLSADIIPARGLKHFVIVGRGPGLFRFPLT